MITTNGSDSGGSFIRHPSALIRSDRIGVVDHVAHPQRAYIDVDQHRPPSVSQISAVARIVGLRIVWTLYRRTLRGWHVVIAMRDRLTPGETIALQACLGSDRRRETLNLMRAVSIRRGSISGFWSTRYNILYARKLRP